jgi:hypothetical protein
MFFDFFEYFEFKIYNRIMHKDYLEFTYAYYYLIIAAYFVNYLEFKKVKSYVTNVYGLIELIA